MFDYHILFLYNCSDTARVINNVIFVERDFAHDLYHVFYVSDTDEDSFNVFVEHISIYEYRLFLDTGEI